MNKKYFEINSFKKDTKLNGIIWEKGEINNNTPIFLILDGQILKTEEIGFNRYDGIEIFKHLENNKIFSYILIAVESMKSYKDNKYNIRMKELKNNNFIKEIKSLIENIKKLYKGEIYGIGFSTSASIIMQLANQLKWVISISPWLEEIKNKKLPENISIFYGNKEFKEKSNANFYEYINIFQKENKNINFIMYKDMIHSFNSWNQNFDHIIKSTYIALTLFKKNNYKGLGKYMHDGSNISYINDNIHLKIHFNKISSNNKELDFINKTHYKNDYLVQYENAYIKKFYHADRKEKLLKSHLIMLIKELNLIHKTPISKSINTYEYKNEFDNDIKVMSHGDINYKNILFSEKRAYLIDFEWGMIHSYYWDIAHIVKNFKLDNKFIEIIKKSYINEINDMKLDKMIKIITKVEKEFFKENNDYFIVGNKNE